MIPDLGKAGQTARQSIDIYMLVEQFFNKFFNSLLLNLFMTVFPKEQAIAELDRLFNANLQALDGGLKQIQMNDLQLYIEIKKAIQNTFDGMRLMIEKGYGPTQEKSEKPADDTAV